MRYDYSIWKSRKKREVMAITGGLGRDRDLDKKPLTKRRTKRFKKEKRF
jgi:hypothetical protein